MVSLVYVTHDQAETMSLADRIVLLRPLDSRPDGASVAQVGPPLELYHHPADRFVAGFVGSPAMNLMRTWVVSLADGRVGLTARGAAFTAAVSAQGLRTDRPVTLGIRPEHVIIAQGPH